VAPAPSGATATATANAGDPRSRFLSAGQAATPPSASALASVTSRPGVRPGGQYESSTSQRPAGTATARKA